MTDTNDNAPEEESERIRKWREERAKVAEEERQRRLAQAEEDKKLRIQANQEERDLKLAAEAEQRRADIQKLIPSEEELAKARQDLRRRTRQRRWMLMLQVAAFVVLPTAVALWYHATRATPLFETQAVVAVTRIANEQDSEFSGVLSGIGSNETLKETFRAQAYIESKAMMNALEEKTQVITEFSGAAIDPVYRLREMPVLGISTHNSFDRFVRSSVDIQTGMIKLYVYAPTQDRSVGIASDVIGLTASYINALAEDLYVERQDQARIAVDSARADLREAQSHLTQLQIDSGEIDPRARVASVLATVDSLTMEALSLRVEIEEMEVIGGNAAAGRAEQLRERETLLLARIERERARLVQPATNGQKSLNEILILYDLAALETKIAEEALTAALQSFEAARQDAALGRYYFQVVVPPVPSENPVHPALLRVALLSLLFFGGLFSVVRVIAGAR